MPAVPAASCAALTALSAASFASSALSDISAAARRAWMTPVGYAERGVGIDALVENGAIACSDMRSLPAMVQGIWNNHLRFQDNG